MQIRAKLTIGPSLSKLILFPPISSVVTFGSLAEASSGAGKANGTECLGEDIIEWIRAKDTVE
jgi:hypothetical protein